MASVIGRGYNAGVSNSGTVNSMGSDQVHVTSPDQNGVQHTIVPNNDYAGKVASQLASMSGTSDTFYGDALRLGDLYRSLNSAETQARADRQMEYQTMSDRYAMNWSAEEAAKNREWQERLANTAHQREVEDLLKAGLNPILSAGNNGASTPSGSVGQSHSSSGVSGQVDMTNPVEMLSTYFLPILNSALTMNSLGIQQAMQHERNITDMQVAQEHAGATIYAADQGYNSAVISAEAGERNNKRTTESSTLAHKLDNMSAEQMQRMKQEHEKEMWRLNNTVKGDYEKGKAYIDTVLDLADYAYDKDPLSRDPQASNMRGEAGGSSSRRSYYESVKGKKEPYSYNYGKSSRKF